MSKTEQKTIEGFRNLAKRENELVSGVVVAGSVDEEAMTCSVDVLTQDAPIEGVLLNATEDETTGFILIPEDGSDVVVGSIDGQGENFLVRASKIKKVIIGANVEIVMNGGTNGGLIKIEGLVSRLNDVERALIELKTKFNAHVHVLTLSAGTGSAAVTANPATNTVTQTSKAQIENTKIKH